MQTTTKTAKKKKLKQKWSHFLTLFSFTLCECTSYYVSATRTWMLGLYIIRYIHFATEPFMCITFGFPWKFSAQTDALLLLPLPIWHPKDSLLGLVKFVTFLDRNSIYSIQIKYCQSLNVDACTLHFYQENLLSQHWNKIIKQVNRVHNSDHGNTLLHKWKMLCATLRYL